VTTATILRIALACAFLFALHLLATWAESRGWIYYRKGRGRSWSVGAAAQELQSLLQPSSRHAIELSQQQELEREDLGESSDL
jgi:hypothetical protein